MSSKIQSSALFAKSHSAVIVRLTGFNKTQIPALSVEIKVSLTELTGWPGTFCAKSSLDAATPIKVAKRLSLTKNYFRIKISARPLFTGVASAHSLGSSVALNRSHTVACNTWATSWSSPTKRIRTWNPCMSLREPEVLDPMGKVKRFLRSYSILPN